MTQVAPAPVGARPEDLISGTTDPAERKRLTNEVVKDCQPNISTLVGRLRLSPQNRADAEQAGRLGLLEALTKYKPPPVNTSGAFWAFARHYVVNEIQKWMDVGMFWSKRRQRKGSKVPTELPLSLDVHEETALLRDESNNPETVCSSMQLSNMSRQFVASLPADEARVIARSDSTARRYVEIVTRAREAFGVAKDGAR